MSLSRVSQLERLQSILKRKLFNSQLYYLNLLSTSWTLKWKRYIGCHRTSWSFGECRCASPVFYKIFLLKMWNWRSKEFNWQTSLKICPSIPSWQKSASQEVPLDRVVFRQTLQNHDSPNWCFRLKIRPFLFGIYCMGIWLQHQGEGWDP